MSPLRCPCRTTSATRCTARSKVSRVEPARSPWGVRVTSRMSTRTAAGAVLYTSKTNPKIAAILSAAEPEPSSMARTALMKIVHCSSKTLSSSSSLFRK